jgi:hypothetical protein
MRTLADYRVDYEEFSGKASDVSRNLGFAAIATIWIFKNEVVAGTSYALAGDLYWAGIGIALSLACELLQYVVSTAIWGWYWRSNEKEGLKPGAHLDAPAYYLWPGLFFFWTKLALMVVAYYKIIVFLGQHISATY